MILSTTSELNALLPANVSSNAERWLALMEQTERTYIIPVLGKPLYAEVQDEYERLRQGEAIDEEGTLLEIDMLVTTESDGMRYKYTPMQQLIRLLQIPLVYMTLSNNAGLLAISLNDGGMNSVSAEGYDASKKEDREAFARDCYLNAHKGIEQVLLFLEEDARSEEPSFLTKWMQSSYFYQQNGLLLRTAMEFDTYVHIAESRETFLQLVPSMRNVQENKIRPELGDTLLNAFIQFVAFGPQRKKEEVSPEPDDNEEETGEKEPVPARKELWDEVSSLMTSSEAFDEDLRGFFPYERSAGASDDERYKLRCWNKALSLLRSALAYYVEDGNKKLKRPDSYNDAMSNLDRAKKFISSNSAAFEGVIEESPLFVEDETVKEEPDEDSECPSRCPEAGREDYIFDPLGSFFG